jgi:hypothetical protein
MLEDTHENVACGNRERLQEDVRIPPWHFAQWPKRASEPVLVSQLASMTSLEQLALTESVSCLLISSESCPYECVTGAGRN